MIKAIGNIGFAVAILLCLVGLSSAISRVVVTVEYLADPAFVIDSSNEPPGATGFNARYYQHPYLTLVHSLPGILFMTLGPVQFVPSVRNRFLRFHRWSGRVFMLASLVGVVSALLFVGRLPVFGSLSTSVGVVFAGTLFLVCLVQGYRTVRRRQFLVHREWMIRTFAIGLGISMFRVLVPVLMMPPLEASFPEAWDASVWLAFGLNTLSAEVWINLTRAKSRERAWRLRWPCRRGESGSPVARVVWFAHVGICCYGCLRGVPARTFARQSQSVPAASPEPAHQRRDSRSAGRLFHGRAVFAAAGGAVASCTMQ